jgi:predicted nucleic acid-binding protein
MTGLVFVDTNVLLYARDAGEPAKQARAIEWLTHLWRTQSGRTSIQVLNEFYVNAARRAQDADARQDAWDDVQSLFSWAPQPLDIPVIEQARTVELRYRLSWWDALIVAAARVQGCTTLLTEDLQHAASYVGVTVCSPFVAQVADVRAAYEQAPSLVSRYRGRGRPRRQAA